ncbi:MAG: M28 family peptidase [Alphaproteobacteria bacterium]|nr:M28 family peptidase [Alphaproteobacteria bacterium]
MRRSIFFSLSFVLAASSALAQGTLDKSVTDRFDAALSSQDQIGWLKMMASEPNQVGSPHDKLIADWELQQFRKFGWDAHIETFQVLFSTPVSEAVEMGSFKATLQEKPIPGDTSSTAKDYALPAYLAYQGDGDVTAPLVYVNYGTQEDYKQLARLGISVKGKIVIARYGQVWRGVKPLLAYKHGAIGCLIYSDPADDGYAEGATYPEGPMRPPQGIQRGSAMDMMLYPGDPLTPGVGATADAKRLTHETAPSVLKIPALPISYADAQVLLKAMTGPVAPQNWRGALPITYRVGPGSQPVHLEVKSSWDLQPAYDVIAQIKGSQFPDQWVVRGNHHDGWVEGASDPLSGQVALLDEAKAMGALLKTGWRPKRTIVYTSWDGEEPMLLGSTEWAEQHAAELKKKAVLYINTDGNSRGFLRASGNQDLGAFVTKVSESVTDPEANVTVGRRARDRLLTAAGSGPFAAAMKAEASRLEKPGATFPVGAAGSGSDFSPFLDHLGVTTLNLGFGGEAKSGGVYHSRYDTSEHHLRFIDPGLVYGKVLSETVGHAVLAAAGNGLPLSSPADFARAMKGDITKVEKLADSQREAAQKQKMLLASNAYAVAADPTEPHGNPVAMSAVPAIDFKPLDAAGATLTKSAAAYEAALAAHGQALPAADAAKLNGLMQTINQTLLYEGGLPGRPWYKNLIYAPGRYVGYGVTTLPGVTEAITEERWSDVPKFIALTSDALKAYAARLDQATALLQSSKG